MHILGLSSLEHGPAAAIIGETGLIAAIEEGKLARTRTAEGIPRRAIQFCLESARVKWPDVDRIAIASRPGRAWSRTVLFSDRADFLKTLISVKVSNAGFRSKKRVKG